MRFQGFPNGGMSYDPALNCTSPLYAGCYLKWILLANASLAAKMRLFGMQQGSNQGPHGEKNNLIISLVAVPCRVNGKAY